MSNLLVLEGNARLECLFHRNPINIGLYIKIIMLCDSSTKFVIDAISYLGKDTVPPGQPAADFFVTKLASANEGSNRNITFGFPESWLISGIQNIGTNRTIKK